jgi:hypothetical protein
MIARAMLLSLAALPAFAEVDEAPPALVTGAPFDELVEKQPGGESWLVLRYLTPEIAGGAIGYEALVPELDRLCATAGLARAAALDAPPGQIVIVLMDRVVERGVPAPEATQYIGSYLPVEGECQWE